MEESADRRQIAARSWVRAWLWVVALMILAMIVVGGATRLTDSGLSITEWNVLMGVIPPLTESDWLSAFEKYKQIPEYALNNRDMTLVGFKFIYWWEWTHRLLGRLIGVLFFIPFVIFWSTGRLEARLLPRLGLIFILGGLQGVLGWYMVASGLIDRVDVSQYRLAAHLTLATVIFAAVVWTALGIGVERRADLNNVPTLGLVALIILQIAAGGFVAGLDAGQGYNTWPLIDGSFIPNGLLTMVPAWRNFFENALTVQFDHRMLAYAIVFYAVLLALVSRLNSARLALAAVLLQAALGIWTLLAKAPLSLSLAHQAGAMAVLIAALWHLHRSVSRSPVRDRQ